MIILLANYQMLKKLVMLFIMVGGPGSGKTSCLNILLAMLKQNSDDYVTINPDDILANFFKSDRRYYKKVNPINDKLYETVIKNKYNIIFDRTGTNFVSYYNDVIKKLKTKDIIILQM
tara:strand:- start:79 stop:432 length:354 start_codon:yes stop_codon:yes gene_type:complete